MEGMTEDPKRVLCCLWASIQSTYELVKIRWRIQGRHPWAPLPPLFFDQNEARSAEKRFLETGPSPLISGSGWPTPPPPPYLKVWIRHWDNFVSLCDIQCSMKILRVLIFANWPRSAKISSCTKKKRKIKRRKN